MAEHAAKFCQACGEKLPGRARFCPACGRRIGPAAPKLAPAQILLLLVSALVIWGVAQGMLTSLAGSAPQTAYKQDPHGEERYQDPVLERLRQAVKAAPDDKATAKALALALLQKIKDSDKPASALIFEAIEVLSGVLKLDADDNDALLALADISFEQQAFPKALEFYMRYLKVKPDDISARMRYASTLSFLGDFNTAKSELSSILEKDPRNFHANAYLAITLAQMGDKTGAKSAGQNALKFAPDEEARARFSGFLQNLDKPVSAELDVPQGAQALVETVRTNAIAGPKFTHAEEQQPGTVALYFENFPMDQMPPFAKEKFFAGLREKSGPQVKNIIFIDKASGREMERLALKGNSK